MLECPAACLADLRLLSGVNALVHLECRAALKVPAAASASVLGLVSGTSCLRMLARCLRITTLTARLRMLCLYTYTAPRYHHTSMLYMISESARSFRQNTSMWQTDRQSPHRVVEQGPVMTFSRFTIVGLLFNGMCRKIFKIFIGQ